MNPLIDRAYRQAAHQAQRRRQIALWLERYEQLQRTPTRSQAEQEAKMEALQAMREAQP